MTDEQRDLGRVISVTILTIILLFAMLVSCSPYYYKSNDKPIITHVLALNSEGDTLKIPIKDIKPNVIYNVIGYDWYQLRSGYYNRWSNPYYHPIYHKPYNFNDNGNSGYNYNNNNNTPNPPATKSAGSVTPPSTPVNPRKN